MIQLARMRWTVGSAFPLAIQTRVVSLVVVPVMLAVLAVAIRSNNLAAQGLSGTPQRFDETLAQGVSFTNQVATILTSKCGQCHVRGSKGDFNMSTFAKLMAAPGVVTPGQPQRSSLYTLVAKGEMPPRGKLSSAEVNAIRGWIQSGAKFDGANQNATLGTGGGGRPAPGGGRPASRRGGSSSFGGGDMEGYDDSGYDDDMDDDGDEGYGGGYDDDMDDDGDYGMDDDGGYGGFGGSPSGASVRLGPPSDAVQTYGSSLVALMGQMDLSPLWAPAHTAQIQTGPVLRREADEAFASGNMGLALNLAYAHIAAEYPESMPTIRTVKYNRFLLRRPVWATRWGVSISIRGEGTSNPSPIRQGATPLRSNPGRGGGGFGGFDGMESEMEMEMGDMESEMEADMGDMEMEMMMEMEMGGGGPASRRSPAVAEVPQRTIRKMLDETIAETFDENLGLVAEHFAKQFEERFRRGDYGSLFTDVTATESPETMSEELDLALSEAESLPMWQPYLPFVGNGPAPEMIEAARANGIELLVHFDVNLKMGRNQQVQNYSRVRLINVLAQDSKGRYGRTVVSSKSFNSSEAAQFAAAGRMDEQGYVEERMANLFEVIDKQAKVEPLPRLTPEIASKRVASLIATSKPRDLRVLAEIRLYQAAKWIDEQQAEAAFDIMGGSQGLALLYGPLETRLQIARQWAVEGLPKP